jgi:hypothetical protein
MKALDVSIRSRVYITRMKQSRDVSTVKWQRDGRLGFDSRGPRPGLIYNIQWRIQSPI